MSPRKGTWTQQDASAYALPYNTHAALGKPLCYIAYALRNKVPLGTATYLMAKAGRTLMPGTCVLFGQPARAALHAHRVHLHPFPHLLQSLKGTAAETWAVRHMPAQPHQPVHSTPGEAASLRDSVRSQRSGAGEPPSGMRALHTCRARKPSTACKLITPWRCPVACPAGAQGKRG